MLKDLRNIAIFGSIFSLVFYSFFGPSVKTLAAGLACAMVVSYLIDILEELRKMNQKEAEPKRGCGGNCKCKDKNVLQG